MVKGGSGLGVQAYESKKEIVSFTKLIKANTTDVLHERIKADGTIESVKVRIYQGVQKSLRILPFIEHKGSKTENILTFPSTTDPYITGDDDYFIYDVTIPVEYDDFLKVWVQNIDSTHDYTLSVTVEVDYIGGRVSRG